MSRQNRLSLPLIAAFILPFVAFLLTSRSYESLTSSLLTLFEISSSSSDVDESNSFLNGKMLSLLGFNDQSHGGGRDAATKYYYSSSPHYASWNSWWFHRRMWTGHGSDSFRRHHHRKGRSKTSKSEWNVLYHLGGNGPWIELDPALASTAEVEMPAGCAVDQVHMV